MQPALARRFRFAPAALAAVLGVGAWLGDAGPAHSADVLIYRCTDASGHLSLRDTPCADGQHQQTMTMARPVDPPPRIVEASVAPPPSAPMAEPRTRVVMVSAPQPMFDCVRPDGSTYTSSNGDGNPRMVPLVDLGYGAGLAYSDISLGNRIGAPPPRLGDPAARVAVSGHRGHVRYAASARTGGYYPGGYNYGYGVYYGSQLVRDECQQLPPAEVCARLRDRRYEGDRRYNSALQSERAQITQEQRVIDARLKADCGAY